MLKQIALALAIIFAGGCATVPFSGDMIPRLHEVEDSRDIIQQRVEFMARLGVLPESMGEQMRVLMDTQHAYYLAAQVEMAAGNSEKASHYLNKMQDALDGINTLLDNIETDPVPNSRMMF